MFFITANRLVGLFFTGVKLDTGVTGACVGSTVMRSKSVPRMACTEAIVSVRIGSVCMKQAFLRAPTVERDHLGPSVSGSWALGYLMGAGGFTGRGVFMGAIDVIGRGALMGRGPLMDRGPLTARGPLKGARRGTNRGGLKKDT
jgi:hypothetical protein